MTSITPRQIAALRTCVEVADPGDGRDPAIEQIITDATDAIKQIEAYKPPTPPRVWITLGIMIGLIIGTLACSTILWRMQ